MADGGEKHEAARELRRLQRHRQAQDPGERMDDDDRLFDAQRLQGLTNIGRLPARRGGGAAGEAVAPAVARAVDGEDAEAFGRQTLGERDMKIGEIAGGAVDEHDRAALRTLRRRFDDMQPAGADVDPMADGGKAALDMAAQPQGEGEGQENQRAETDERGLDQGERLQTIVCARARASFSGS